MDGLNFIADLKSIVDYSDDPLAIACGEHDGELGKGRIIFLNPAYEMAYFSSCS